MNPRTGAALAVGGVAGAAARWGVLDLWPASGSHWATLAVNAAGSLLLGWLLAGSGPARPGLHAAATGGFCGSFTTFSAFSLVVAEYLRAGRGGVAVGYAAATLTVAVAAAVAGGLLRRRRRGRAPGEAEP